METQLKIMIKESGIKQKFLAEKLNVHSSTLSLWLVGARKMPSDKREELKSLIEKYLCRL